MTSHSTSSRRGAGLSYGGLGNIGDTGISTHVLNANLRRIDRLVSSRKHGTLEQSLRSATPAVSANCKRLKSKIQSMSIGMDARSLLTLVDPDESGSLDPPEFRLFVRTRLRIRDMLDEEIDEVFTTIDHSGDGLLSLEELITWVKDGISTRRMHTHEPASRARPWSVGLQRSGMNKDRLAEAAENAGDTLRSNAQQSIGLVNRKGCHPVARQYTNIRRLYEELRNATHDAETGELDWRLPMRICLEDREGDMSFAEFVSLIRELSEHTTRIKDAHMYDFFRLLDVDGCGAIERRELCAWLFRLVDNTGRGSAVYRSRRARSRRFSHMWQAWDCEF